MERPQRKHTRLKEYDYSQDGCYFVTICVKNRENLLSEITVGRAALSPPSITLTAIGRIADRYIQNINKVYMGVSVDKYVIMPDHIHLLILFDHFSLNMDNPVSSHTTLSTLVRSFKKMVTRELGYSIWQTSFYDRVIRSPEEYCETCKYIEDNPRKWYEKMQ